MVHYSLYLDESGNFKERNNSPSCVAGYLTKSSSFTSDYVRNILTKVGNKKIYSSINWRNFHAVDEAKKGHPVGAFITEVLEAIQKKIDRLIIFNNRQGLVIVDSDRTYLTVFSDGIMALLKELMQQTTDDISLKVLYAHRQIDKEREINKREIRIPAAEYSLRIRERVEHFVAALPEYQRKRIHISEFKTDNAIKEPLLMIADATCFALRGGVQNFSASEKERINVLPKFEIEVPELTILATLQEMLLQGRTAEAIFMWYSGLYTDTDKINRLKFEERICQFLSSANAKERQIIKEMLSQYVGKLVHDRRFEETNKLIANMDAAFFPLLKKNHIEIEELYFDLHFYRLTTATHEGNNKRSEREMDICRSELLHLPAEYSSLDYYLRYKLRESEVEKNMFAFNEAVANLKNLENIMVNLVSITKMIDELGDLGSRLKSSTLAKVYGSLAQTYGFLSVKNADMSDEARKYSDLAIEEFVKNHDKKRQYQYRSAIECVANQYQSALEWLMAAFSLNADETEDILLKRIVSSKDSGERLFGFVHYANLMARSMRNSDDLGRKMFDAWVKLNIVDELRNDNYPIPIILWRVGTCKAILRQKNSASFFERAANSMKNESTSTNFATALAVEAELAAWQNARRKEFCRLREDTKKFLISDIPDTMRAYFSSWSQKLDNENVSANELFAMADAIPVL